LLTGALISYLVWHDKPALSMLAGGSLIIASGVLIALAARNGKPALSPGVVCL
jgi:drug/metabolite transporter (DMT)-like permease